MFSLTSFHIGRRGQEVDGAALRAGRQTPVEVEAVKETGRRSGKLSH